MTQEKITITKDKAENFDKIFDYPCWVDFTDDANQIIFKKILKNELADEQIDYFLGASDTFHDYDQWFNVAKHILATTNDAHVFWVAGDILSVIWRAIPEDKKSEKWFKDQVFEIFWPRVNSIWPIQNEHKIDFDQDAETKILEDSINWLHTLDDLKERLPELGDYEVYSHNTDEATFTYNQGALLELLNSNPTDIDRIFDLFFTMSDSASTEKNVKTLQEIADEKLLPLINTNQDEYTNKIVKLTHDAIKHAKDYLASLTRERQNLAKLIK